MVRGESLSRRWQQLCISAAILLVSIPGQALASVANTPEARTNETQHQLESPPTGQPAVKPATEQPAPVNPVQEIRLVIRLTQRRVYVYQGAEVQTSYPIAIGRAGWETPTGTFKVMHMERDPYWEHPLNGQVIPPGTNNPLGRRWIGFWTDGKNFIGFHGTPNERLIGQAVSHGCIRMRNRDVEALYDQVTVGTPVIVQR